MRLIVPPLFLLFLSCFNQPAPDWISNQPSKTGYWFGIGIVEKPFKGNDIREEAHGKALSEIASQISVDVSGSFKQVITETNLSLDEYAESIIQTRVDNNLSNIEIVDFYDGKDRYYLLARLSQKIYYDSLERKRKNAVESAIGLLEKAESELTVQSFTALAEAMNEISPYLDIPIKEEYPKGSGKVVNLYSTIKLLANTMVDRIQLLPKSVEFEIKLGMTQNVNLQAQIIDSHTNHPLNNFPVTGSINDDIVEGIVLSDNNGNCTFSLPVLNDKASIKYMNFKVRINDLIGDSQLFGKLPSIHGQTLIKILPPDILVQIKEYNLGEETENPYITPVIIEFFSNLFSANFVETKNADFIIYGVVNSRLVSEKPNDYGIYQTFADATISISKGDSGEKLIEKSFNKIQGSDFSSNHESANQALKKLSEKISKEFLPELSKILQ